MKIQDAIDYAETRFNCKLGAPGHSVDSHPVLAMSLPVRREYVTIAKSVDSSDMPYTGREMAEHVCGAALINTLADIADRNKANKLKLWWRFADKVRFGEDTTGSMSMITRLYIDGITDYGRYQIGTGIQPPQLLLRGAFGARMPAPVELGKWTEKRA